MYFPHSNVSHERDHEFSYLIIIFPKPGSHYGCLESLVPSHCSGLVFLVSKWVSTELCSTSLARAHCSCFVLVSQWVSADLCSPSLARAHCSCFVLVSQWVSADLCSPSLARAHYSCSVLVSQSVSADLYTPSLAQAPRSLSSFSSHRM